jgi:hypothetical protein
VLSGERLSEQSLVSIVGVCVQQRHGYDVASKSDRGASGCTRSLGIERSHDTMRRDSFGHAHPIDGIDQGWRVSHREVVEGGAILTSQLEQIREPRRGDQGDARAVALEQRVGRDGRPMHDTPDRRAVAKRVDRRFDALALVTGRAQHLARIDGTVGSHRDQVGERATDIHTDAAHAGRQCGRARSESRSRHNSQPIAACTGKARSRTARLRCSNMGSGFTRRPMTDAPSRMAATRNAPRRHRGL